MKIPFFNILPLLFLFFLKSNISFSLNHTIDSLHKELKLAKHDTTKASIYVAISDVVYEINKDSTEEFINLCNQAILICDKNIPKSKKIEQLTFKLIKSDALKNIGVIMLQLGNFDKAIDYLNISLSLRQETGDKEKIIDSFDALIGTYYTKGDLEKSLEYSYKSLEMAKTINNEKVLALSYHGVAFMQINIGNVDKAEDLWRQALKIYQKIGDRKNEAKMLFHIGIAYRNKNNLDSAEFYWKKSLEVREKIDDIDGLHSSINSIAFLFFKRKKYDEALKYFQKAFELAKQTNSLTSNDYSNMGSVYYYKKNYKKALDYFTQAYKLAENYGQYEYIEGAAGNLTNVYEKLGNYALSLKFLKIQIEYEKKDKRQLAKNMDIELMHQKKVIADSVAFEKEKEIKELEISKQKAELKAKKNQQFALYGGLFLVILFAGFMYNRFKVTHKQKGIIELQKQEVEQQKHIVEEKNKEITDSINYAKRIQEAILPSRYTLTQSLKNGFILYKPKDIVAGDFYWLEQKNDIVLFAAADCTGHGVPGAMVSVICSNALSKTVLEENITTPSKILDRTKELVVERLSKNEENVKDGMDISLCALNLKTKELEWAGANNPLWIIRNNSSELEEIKPDKQPIGKTDQTKPFTNHNVTLNQGDSIYIFTDGYQDQFGGEKGKKFKPAQLKELLLSIQSNSMDEQKELLNNAFENWKGSLDQIDDVCIIGVKI